MAFDINWVSHIRCTIGVFDLVLQEFCLSPVSCMFLYGSSDWAAPVSICSFSFCLPMLTLAHQVSSASSDAILTRPLIVSVLTRWS